MPEPSSSTGGAAASQAARLAKLKGGDAITPAPSTQLTQDEDERAELLARSTAGSTSASGQERDRILLGEDIPSGKDRGSQEKIEGGAPKPDYPAHTAPKPTGAQAEPALMVRQGTLEIGLVPSPTGPIPADRASALAIEPSVLEASQTGTFGLKLDPAAPLSDELLETLDGATLRAVAADRGYLLPHGARGATRAVFREKQQADPRFKQNSTVSRAATPPTKPAA
jgi:hypothetical protein